MVFMFVLISSDFHMANTTNESKQSKFTQIQRFRNELMNERKKNASAIVSTAAISIEFLTSAYTHTHAHVYKREVAVQRYACKHVCTVQKRRGGTKKKIKR